MTRNPQLDFLRGIAMFLVVLAHSGFCGTGYIYLFHVPMFFIVSGALFRVREERPFAQLGRKFTRLYLPNLWFGLLFVALHNVFCAAGFYSSGAEYTSETDFVRAVVKVITWGNEPVGGALWFLRSLFATYFLFWIVEMFCRLFGNDKTKKVVRWCSYILIVAAGWVSAGFEQFYGVRTFVSIPAISLGYVVMGFYLPQANKFVKRAKPWLCFVVCALLLGIASHYIRIDLAHLKLPNPIVYYLLGACGMLMVISLHQILANLSFSKVFEYIGRHSMSVLGLHFLAFKIAMFIIIFGGGQICLSNLVPNPSERIFTPFLISIFAVLLSLGFGAAYGCAKKKLISRFSQHREEKI